MRKFFDSIVTPVDQGSKDSLYKLFCAAAFSASAIFLIAIGLALRSKEAGQFGDFIGGTLNPILTFLTFMGLLVTIVLQQQELADSRKELARSATALEEQSRNLNFQSRAVHRQNFENTFFQMLTLHNQLLSAMDVSDQNGHVFRGKDCFSFFYEKMKENYAKHQGNEEAKIRFTNDAIWDVHHKDLAHYFRYILNIFELISPNDGNNPNYQLNDIERQRYADIFSSQLSSFEMLLIFYNGLTDHAGRLKGRIEHYGTLEHAPFHLLLNREHRKRYSPSAFKEAKASTDASADTGDSVASDL